MTTLFPIPKDSRTVSRIALDCQFLPKEINFNVTMDDHQALHVGCENEAYKQLPLETGSDDLELDQARVKLQELDTIRCNGFLKNPSEDEICELLQDVARVTNAAGRINRYLLNLAQKDGHKAIARDPLYAPAFGTWLNSNAMFRSALIEFSESFYAWLDQKVDPLHAACVDNRMTFISKEGLRQGDKSRWKSCFQGAFQGRWFREASSDGESARTSGPSQDTNSAAFEHNDSDGIPYLFIPHR